MGGGINFDERVGSKKVVGWGGVVPPTMGNPAFIRGGSLSSTVISLFGIVNWGKEQPKITNLAVTPQP